MTTGFAGATRACQLSGVDQKLQQRRATLRDMEAFLVQLAREAERAQSEHELYRGMELLARGIGASCDLLIGVLAEAVNRTTPGVGTGISEIYDVSKLLVKASNGELVAKDAFDYSAKKKLLAVKHHYGPASRTTRLIDRIEQLYALGSEIADYARGSGGARGLESARRTAQSQLGRIRLQLMEIERQLKACSTEEPVVNRLL